MNKKEIAEIRKQFTQANCAATRICGCYVNAEKEKVTTFAEPFLALPEEEIFKYFEIFRKTLSGTLGKNLLDMEYSLQEEMDELHGADTPHSLLMGLRDSCLKDDDLLSAYYDGIVESFTCSGHYLILVLHAVYDVPGRTSDGITMEDASDEAYSFILSCICPVSLAKPALSYDMKENRFGNRVRDWIVDMPELGFLFPAFNDRRSDIHALLYYSRSADELHFDFTGRMLGCTLPLPASDQKEVFVSLVEEALGDGCVYEVVQNLHEQLHELAARQKDEPEPLLLSQPEVHDLLEMSGAEKEQLDRFDEIFRESLEEEGRDEVRFLASNITNARRFEVRTPDVVIRVSPDRADLVEQRVIDGRACLVIPITDQVQVNGIRVVPSRLE